MKNRWISALLLVSMMLSMVVVPAYANETEDPATTGVNAPIDFASSTTQVCPVCGGSAKDWQPLPQITAATNLAPGHYYIPDGGVTNKANYTFTNSSAANPSKICIHLNGNTLSSSDRTFNAAYSAQINIFGSGEVESTSNRSGALFYLSSCTVSLYGGSYDMPNATSGYPIRLESTSAKFRLYSGATISTANWRCVYMTAGTVTMSGGTITGGHTSGKSGGNVYVDGGTFNMSGGTISDGIASNYGGNVYINKGTFKMSGGTISGGNASDGGNVYVANNGIFSMTGGTISGGYASNNGGNVCASTNTFSIGGTVLNGTAGSSGGNICVSTDSVLTVSGTVAGGSVEGTGNGDWGGNIRAWQATVNIESGAKIYGGSGGGKPGAANIGCLGEEADKTAVLNINGGTITGDIHTSAPVVTDGVTVFPGTQVKITGAPSIVRSIEVDGVNYSATRQGLRLQDGLTIDISGMTGGSVYLSGSNGQAMTAAHENASLMDGCFLAYNTAQQVDLQDDVFYLAERQNAPETFAPWDNEGKAYCPACKEEKTWSAVSGSGIIGEQVNGTHIYLNSNYDGTGVNQVLSAGANATVCFNLNGMTLSMDGRIATAKAGATLNLMDTSADGTGLVTSTGSRTEHAYYGYTVMNQQDAVINLYGGTYRNSNPEKAVIRCNVASAEINVFDGAVIDGNGQTRAIYMVEGTVNINGGVVKNGVSSGDGGNIYMEAGKLNVKGGKIFGGSAVNGGNLYIAGGTAKITDDDDANTNAPQFVGGTATTGNGGSIYCAAALIMDAGTVSGGVATAGNGGNIYSKADLDLSDCTIKDGNATADSGGNIYLAGASSSAKVTCNIGDGVLISGGKAKNGGGVAATQTVIHFTGGEITGGTSTNAGGCLYLATGATMNLSGGTVSDGTASGNGGNVYTASTNSTIKMTGGIITGGTSNNSGTSTGGGNIFLNNGILNMSGGVISNGKAPKAYGGNIHSRTGMNHKDNKVLLNDDGNAATPKPLITGGQSKYTGGNIYINGDRYNDLWSYITIGDCEITNGDAASYTYGDDISLQHSGRLTILSGFAGEADTYIPTCCLPADMLAGGAVDNTAIVTQGAFPGKLVLEQFENPYAIVGKTGSTQAYICDTGIEMADGSVIWLTNNADIAAQAANYDHCILRAAPGELCLNDGNYMVDLRGNAVHFTGTGTVTLLDSTNDSYETFGTATTDGVEVSTGMKEVNGKSYYTIDENGIYSAHRVEYALSKVSLRTTVGGIYFTGKWQCDETLKKYIDAFGVAVSVADMPKKDFEEDGHSAWTVFGKDEFENGVEKNGVLVKGILKDTSADRISKNSQYAQMQIYAAAYINVGGEISVGAGMSRSLYDVLQVIDKNINSYYKSAGMMQTFMGTWASKGLSGEEWNFNYTPSEDAVRLNELYTGRTAYHGEFHDHADTGGESDGKANLSKIKDVMEVKGIDFTTILDHKQILHMELPEWDSRLFIGGSEMTTIIYDKKIDNNKPHVNMIFSNAEAFKELMTMHKPSSGHPGFTFHLDEASGNWYYDDHQWNTAEFTQLIEDIRTCGGMYVFPHPKDGSRYVSNDPLDYWFADWVGLEVFYGPSYYAPTHERTQNAYQLWKDLLAAGKKLWATAGSDSHNVPNANALTTIYSTEKNAVEHFEHAKQGDMTCGPVGIRMCMGQTLTGGETAFAGQRLSICVKDFHETVVYADHVYTVKVIAGKDGTETAVYTQTIDPSEPFYYGLDADDTCDYYRVEVYDESDTRFTMPIALGNPIWNKTN